MNLTQSKANIDAPHTVVIYFKSEVRELLPTGELSGAISARIPDASGWLTYQLEGKNKDEAVQKLNNFMEKFHESFGHKL